MTRRLMVLAIGLALCLAAAAQAATHAASASGAGRCDPVKTNGRTASQIRTNIGCTRARRLVRRWLRRNKLPRDNFSWYCAGRREVTCGNGNGGNAPYIRFRRTAGTAVVEATTCRHDLYLRSGIGPVRVQRMTCRRAIRTLRTWVRRGMPRSGPRGWRCQRRKLGEEAPILRVRCSRGRARMRFEIGG